MTRGDLVSLACFVFLCVFLGEGEGILGVDGEF